jgi:MoxR-like ATPase
VQFTPDLLPSDVIGVTFYDQKNASFTFRKGPVFASIVLADEINRASPKTQSALLEVMEEHAITVDGATHLVDQPFMVIATQNPLGHRGTYELPEAQLDRFLLKASLGPPDHATTVKILRDAHRPQSEQNVFPLLGGEEILSLRRVASSVFVADSLVEYITRLVEETRHDESVLLGSSLRGALALLRCAQIHAAAARRPYVVPDDVIAFAVPVLAHRIMLTRDAEFDGLSPEKVIEAVTERVAAPSNGFSRNSACFRGSP